MNLFTVSNLGFSRLTRNLVASAGRLGLNMRVYVPSAKQVIGGVGCSVIDYERAPSEAQSINGRGDGFARMTEFKLHVISRMLNEVPALYVDADVAILRDPSAFLEAVQKPVAIQERDCAPRNYGCAFCTGMLYFKTNHPWIRELVRFRPGEFDNDEPFVNRRIERLHPLLRERIGKLPHPQFMLGYFHATPETLIYHANFTQLNGETTMLEEDKIKKLKEEGAWFI